MSADEDPTRCDHPEVEPRRRIQGNGVEVVVRQCLRCGHNCGCVAKASVRLPNLRWWDQGLHDRWQESVSDYYRRWRAQSRQEREDADAAWWRRYEEHLSSPAWHELRRKVFARCAGVCEGCRDRRAVQVHHLTYARLGREMLFDLVAVCLECHDSIHRPDSEGRP
jgi:hypothetical protein